MSARSVAVDATQRVHRPLVWAPAWAGLLPGLLAAAAAHAVPEAGRYDARLCVSIRAGAPDCGPASVAWRRSGVATVRVSDMLYSLTLKSAPGPTNAASASSQVDVVLKHGTMQIDAFTGRSEWKGNTLAFVDADKGVRYEVQFGKRRRPPR